MSSNALPITPARFAAALSDLPLSSLYAKAIELANSISHLQISNTELLSFAQDGDLDCRQAIEENQDVIMKMEERILLLRLEVEKRGQVWHELRTEVANRRVNGDGDVEMSESPTLSGDVGAEERGHRALNRGTNLSGRGNENGDLEDMREDHQNNHDEDDQGIHI